MTRRVALCAILNLIALGLVSADGSCGQYISGHGCGLLLPSAQLSACFENTLNGILAKIGHGWNAPNMKLPSLEPWAVPNIALRSGSLTTTLTACSLHGASKARISASNAQFVRLSYSCDVTVPNFVLQCSYNMPAGFLGAAKANSGTFKMSAANYKAHFDYQGSIVIDKCVTTRARWLSATSKILGPARFDASFSGLGSAQPNAAALRAVLVAALEPAQASLNVDLLHQIQKYYPPLLTWLPPTSTSTNVPVCLAPHPANCD